MARYVVGDTVTLTNTFTVDGSPTDPDTVTLTVTDPDGTTTSPAVTKTAVGVYEADVTVDTAGTWTYVWEGTGAAADVEDGSFEVFATAASDALNIITLGEAKNAINADLTRTSHDDELRQWVTAVSRRIDDLCGPVVARTVAAADKLYDGGRHAFRPKLTPVHTITTLTEYSNTTSTVLTAETNATKPADGYLLDERSTHDVLIRRRTSNADSVFPAGRRNIELDYDAGRYTSTGTVDPKFKTAAAAIIRRMWSRESGSWATGAGVFADQTGTVGFFRAVDPMVAEFLHDEMYPPTVL